MALRVFNWLIRPPFRVLPFLSALEFVGVQSIFIVGLTGMFSGMVFALQTVYGFRHFRQRPWSAGVVAISLAREISPVFTGLMVTSRAGSAMAAELGNMRVTEQIDAIATMGVSPVQYLVVPRVLASVLVMPFLCTLFSMVGMVGAYAVAVMWLGVVLLDLLGSRDEPNAAA